MIRRNELREAEQWFEQGLEKDPKPTGLQLQYITSSRKAVTHRLRLGVAGASVTAAFFLFLALGMLFQYTVSERRRKVASSRYLAVQALNRLDDQLDQAFLLSPEAYQIHQALEAPSSLLTRIIEAAKDYGADHKTLEAPSSLLTGLQYNPHIRYFLHGHRGIVQSVVFSPDGTLLASGGVDSTVILWDVATHQSIDRLEGHTAAVNSVAFSPDGTMLASGSADRTIILWDISHESWRTRACRIAKRNLTDGEWREFLGDEQYRRTCSSQGEEKRFNQ
jgi:WD domain, G-beta repeat